MAITDILWLVKQKKALFDLSKIACHLSFSTSASLQRQSKRLRGRNVHFESVTVYYFARRQGFTTVPTQGGSTLGMSPRHSGVKRFTLREFAMEQKRSHRNMLRDHLKEEKLNAIKLKVSGKDLCLHKL